MVPDGKGVKNNLLSIKDMRINEGDGGYSEDRSVSREREQRAATAGRGKARARKRWDEICLYVADTAAVYLLLVGSGDRRAGSFLIRSYRRAKDTRACRRFFVEQDMVAFVRSPSTSRR